MHIRCPHCQSEIDVDGDVDLSTVVCTACGSTFHLLPETAPFSAGSRSLAHFQLLDQLGSGGFGSVWKARDTKLDRVVAVKIPRRDQLQEGDLELFLREARAAAQLKHPHIVAVHEVGRHDGTLYIVSDFIEGVTLADRLTAGALALREAAEICIQVAGALHHAHEAGVIHRDLKPSNIMLDAEGRPYLMDFGLARREAGEVTMTAEGKVLGTAAYMSPEQARGEGHRADRRTDIYSLGVILFQLLTGERPFRGNERMLLHQVMHDEPPSPRKLNGRVPRDLETICLKCLEKDPRRRYATAKDVGDELRRFLDGQPIHARPLGRLSRTWRWCLRNPRLAGTIATAAAFAAVAMVSIVVGYVRTSEALGRSKFFEGEASQRATEAENSAKQAKTAAQEAQEQARILAVQQLRSKSRKNGWSTAAMQSLGQIRRLRNVETRSHAAACLVGLDAKLLQRRTISGTFVAFDHTGGRLAIGGVSASNPDAKQGSPAHVWSLDDDKSLPSSLSVDGPVTFNADRVPVQLSVNAAERQLHLWSLINGQQLSDFHWPATNDRDPSAIALSDDASLVAAAVGDVTYVWRVDQADPVPTLTTSAAALAFAPGGSLLATGSDDGRATVWDVNSGQKVGDELTIGRVTIKALAFGRNPRVSGTESDSKQRLLLAAADASGTIAIWDLHRRIVKSYCRGSQHGVHAVAFSPDGMTLASVGRFHGKLWDIATGQLLLSLNEANWLTDVKFAPDGNRLAVSSFPVWDADKDQVNVWEIETGRGILALRGLTSVVEKVTISPNGRYVAALSQDSLIGVWDLRSGWLLHVFEAPQIGYTDNAGLAFSPDDRRLAISGSTEIEGQARLWELESGSEIGSWSFRPGLDNLLLFHPRRGLILYQKESISGRGWSRPLAGRVYRFPPGGEPALLYSIEEFAWNLKLPHAPQDGRFLALVGETGSGARTGRQAKVYDAETGSVLWQDRMETENLAHTNLVLNLDRQGKVLTVYRGNDEGIKIAMSVQMPSGPVIDSNGAPVYTAHTGWHEAMPYWLDHSWLDKTRSDKDPAVLMFVPRGKTEPAFAVGLDVLLSGTRNDFNRDGSLFAWGRMDGTVNVCDFAEVKRRLTEIGLGW